MQPVRPKQRYVGCHPSPRHHLILYQKLRRLMENRPPRDVMSRHELANRNTKPPLHYYGFPFTTQYAIDYAKRHHLTIELAEEDREAFGGKTVFDFGDVNDSHFADPDLRHFVVVGSRHLMFKQLSRKCGMHLHSGHPFSLEWDGIIALWSNYDVKERWRMCYNFDDVVEILTSAMNEGDGPESKLQWWFDWDNDVVCGACFASLTTLTAPSGCLQEC